MVRIFTFTHTNNLIHAYRAARKRDEAEKKRKSHTGTDDPKSFPDEQKKNTDVPYSESLFSKVFFSFCTNPGSLAN